MVPRHLKGGVGGQETRPGALSGCWGVEREEGGRCLAVPAPSPDRDGYQPVEPENCGFPSERRRNSLQQYAVARRRRPMVTALNVRHLQSVRVR